MITIGTSDTTFAIAASAISCVTMDTISKVYSIANTAEFDILRGFLFLALKERTPTKMTGELLL
jgi:hypothetical protein